MSTQGKPGNSKSRKAKKALSTIIAYVLLVTFAVVIGVLVYKWMKTYVPQDDLNCPDETSLFIKSENYDCSTHLLTLEIMNNGKFDIGGYFIYAADSPYKTLATIDLTKNQTDATSRLSPYGVKFGGLTSGNSLAPGKTEKDFFDTTGIPRIYSIEIIPLRWQVDKREKNLVSCKDIIIKENLSCYAACVAQSDSITCAGVQCGSKMNNCRNWIDCGGCTGGNLCNSTGQCVPPGDCTDTCASLNWECDSVCGETCGSYSGGCQTGYTCQSGVCISSCTNECTPAGATQCSGNATQTCGEYDGDGCTEWSSVTACTGMTDCVGGNCVTSCGINGCEAAKGETCATCSADCGPCTIGNGVCDPGETCAQEPVACQGHQATCPPGQICVNGACAPIAGGGIGCTNYCISLLHVPPYTTSTCTKNAGQCPGNLQPGGDIYCTNPSLNRCCCIT
jgi:hypothetical protein